MSTSMELMQIVDAILQLSMIVMIGLYFTFSNTVMNALKTFDNGADVMVEINKVILNPLFMGCFIGSALASVYFATTGEGLMAVSGIVFFVGTTLVTVIKNVPLNNLLRDSDRKTRGDVWQQYLVKWVFWNHIRTVSAIASGFLLVL